MRTLPKETQDQVLGELTRNIVDGLKDVRPHPPAAISPHSAPNIQPKLKQDLSKITDDAVWAKCKALDDGSGSVYHGDDPKEVKDVQSWVQAQPPLPSAPAQLIPPTPAPAPASKKSSDPTKSRFDVDAGREYGGLRRAAGGGEEEKAFEGRGDRWGTCQLTAGMGV